MRYDVLRSTFITDPTTHDALLRLQRDHCSNLCLQQETDTLHDSDRVFHVGDDFFSRLTLVAVEPALSNYALLTIHCALCDHASLHAMLADFKDILSLGPTSQAHPRVERVVGAVATVHADSARTQTFWSQDLANVEPSKSLLTPIVALAPHSNRDMTSRVIVVCALAKHFLTHAADSLGTTVDVLTKAAWAATIRKGVVPCRVQFSDCQSVTSFLSQVHDHDRAIVEHGYVSALQVARYSGHEDVDLVDTLFEFLHGDAPKSMAHEIVATANMGSSLHVTIVPDEVALTIVCTFDSTRWPLAQVEALVTELDFTLTHLNALIDQGGNVEQLWTLSPAQTAVIANASTSGQQPLPWELLHHAFESHASHRPDASAIEFEGATMSYGDLNARADSVASKLTDMGVCVGSRVAVVIERCLEFPLGLLSIAKAGGVFMALDATFPTNRLDFILRDASVVAIVTTEAYRSRVDELQLTLPTLYIDANEPISNAYVGFSPALHQIACADDEAYVVYTSGSTGKPKGVPVFHKSAVNTVAFGCDAPKLKEGVRVCQYMAIGFDMCQWEVWASLSHGATLVMRSNDGFDILKTVDVLATIPTGLALLGDPAQYPQFKCVYTGGEALPTYLKDLWCDNVALVNAYGPTEGAMITHVETMSRDKVVTLGKPLANVTSYVLDDNQRPVPVGVVGELYLGGVCVSPCYINLPHQTQERFLTDPFTGGRMFRTGDFVRLLPTGNMDILGRRDNQVKLNGYRIELDEIAEAMMQHPDVSTAAVIVKDKVHLVGYYFPPTVDLKALQQTVTDQLPAYMVPSIWVGLSVMPQNANGKTDKKALEAMEIVLNVEALETAEQQRMAEVWADVLGTNLSDIGRTTSFYALGGDSISAIRLAAKAKSAGFGLTSRVIMKNPIFENMVRLATACAPSDAIDNAYKGEVSGTVTLTPIQHFNFSHEWVNPHFWTQSITLKPRRVLSMDELVRAASQLETHHDMLRARFELSPTGVWSQFIPLRTVPERPNVEFVDLENEEDLDAAVMVKEKSLNLFTGPVYAVTVFQTPSNSQFLHITIHHTLVDLVSYRILLDDLQALLCNKPLGPKSMPFKVWAEHLASQALEWNPSNWSDYLYEDACPPEHGIVGKVQSTGILPEAIANKLDAANAVYGTNVQDLALAALTCAYGELRQGDSIEGYALPLMLEGHGREPWSTDLDVSTTVGWFTSVYPIVLFATSNLANLVRQVKQKLRAVPDGGISYGALKYMVPVTESTQTIVSHRHHNMTFNYAGRFQELNSDNSLFEAQHGVKDVLGPDEHHFSGENLFLHHVDGNLVLDVNVADWLFTVVDVQKLTKLWATWMEKIIDHCLEPSTLGGRTLSDVPLLASSAVLDNAELECLETLHLRPVDVEDMYPATPLQSGLILAMIRDPTDYVLHNIFDIRGDLDLATFRAAWKKLTHLEPVLRTAFVSTIGGIVQVVTKGDLSDWTTWHQTWQLDDLDAATKAFLAKDRDRGFSLQDKSFNRFTVVPVSGICVVGVLVNTIPIVTNVCVDQAVGDLVRSMHASSLDLIPHSHSSLQDIKKWSGVQNELFDSIMMYGSYPEADSNDGGKFSLDFQVADEYVDTNLGLVVYPTGDRFRVELCMNVHQVDERMLDLIDQRFLAIVAKVASPSWTVQPMQSLDVLEANEDALVMTAIKGREIPLPFSLLHNGFEAQAARRPQATALEFLKDSLTYAELNSQASQVASQLTEVGVRVGTRVAVIMERCLEFPIGLLGVLKAGGTMMPMDASFPAGRLSYMMADAGAIAVVTTEAHRARIDEMNLTTPVIFINAAELALHTDEGFCPAANQVATGDDEAYVVYTSGSTGKPKGVPVFHKSAVNTVSFGRDEAKMEEGVRVVQFMAVGFDVCQWEIWTTLSSGATLVLRSEEALDTLKDVNVLATIPTGLSLMGDPSEYPNLTFVQVGGEALPTSLKDLWSDRVRLVNAYGPTECCMLSHVKRMSIGDDVTIGAPLANVTSYVLDEHQRLVPVGVVGELYLGGVCVSPCYINLPEQTSERFVDDPFTGERMFRTGDYARLLPSGNFEILGRKDSQVKLKGYRVELDEVAEAIMQHPNVIAAAALVKDKTHLVGYFSPADVDTAELHRIVSDQLPVYMVPSLWVGLNDMPQNVNGKIDKRALELMDIEVTLESLESKTEELLSSVWSDVLSVELSKIGRNTSFFELGGDSITAIRLVSKARDIGLGLSSTNVMKYPTLWEMASFAKMVKNVSSSDVSVFGKVPLTPIQHLNFEHPWINVHYWNMSFTLQPRDATNSSDVERALKQLLAHHDVLRTRFAFSPTSGWSQEILDPAALTPAPVVVHAITSFDELEEAICAVEKTLHLITGPVFLLSMFETADRTQFLHFTLHHTIVDLVSIRILIDDLQKALLNEPLGPKTTSMKEWSDRLTEAAPSFDPTAWLGYMGDDVPHSTRTRYTSSFDSNDSDNVSRSEKIVSASTSVGAALSSRLDQANATYMTNIQELALAALTGAFAELRGDGTCNFHIMLESHGRDGWNSDLDVSSTVGWFTCEYPAVFSPSWNLADLVRQVKEKLRGVPDNGLSYGAIKYLAPETETNRLIKTHRRHNFSFNYLGKFQEVSSGTGMFSMVDGLRVPQREESEINYSPGSLTLYHMGSELMLGGSVEDWMLSNAELDEFFGLWVKWMERIVEHCLDPSTIGGRTLSDVPLLVDADVLHCVESEMMETLHLRPLDVDDIYPITGLQGGFLLEMIQDPSEYVLQMVFDIRGNFDMASLQTCWHKLALEVPILRTVFVSTPYGMYQAVTKEDLSEWTMLEAVWSIDELETNTKALMQQDRSRDGRTRVLWTQHHAVADGWSLPLVMDRFLATCYGEPLRKPLTPFKHYIEWLSTQSEDASCAFWKQTLKHVELAEQLTFPCSHIEASTAPKYRSIVRVVEGLGLTHVTRSLGATPSSVFRAAWAIVLQEYTRSEYVVFGSVVSGREVELDGIAQMAGVSINTIPILAYMPSTETIVQSIKQMHEYAANSIPHSHCCLVDINKWIGHASGKQLFDTIMVYENYPASENSENPDRPFSIEFQDAEEYANALLTCVVGAHGDGYMVKLISKSADVDAAIIDILMDRLIYVVEQISDMRQQDCLVSSLDRFTSHEAKIIQASNFGPRIDVQHTLLHHGFEAMANRQPTSQAIEFNTSRLTYSELNSQANTVARQLTQLGVCTGTRVAVIMERCLEFPIGLVAVLKAGGTMMPMDATFPPGRLSYMVYNSNAIAVVSTESCRHRIEEMDLGMPVLYIDSTDLAMNPAEFLPAENQIASVDDEAYVLYTSGSTGKPKGVPVLHKSAVNTISSCSSYADLKEGVRVSQFMAMGFDGCQLEIWTTLSNGAILVLRSNEVDILTNVNVMVMTPTGLALMGDPSQYPHLKVIHVGGEAIPTTLKNLWCNHVRLVNIYGPTECCIVSHFETLTRDEGVTVGRPLPNVSSYIMDENARLVPVGVVGELYLGGVCVSPSYIGLPEQTAEHFLDDPFTGGRMFRTGDYARVLPNGKFDVVGRKDSQVKLKGYRIELDEVAEAMMQHPDVVVAAALVKDKTHLVGYFSPASVDLVDLKSTVSKHLPVYMIPSVWVGLDEMPQNSNGKVNMLALKSLDIVCEVEPLETEEEKALAQVWANVLDVDVATIGRQTSFFAIGGDSITSIKVASACTKLGWSVTVRQILTESVLSRVAATATTGNTKSYPRVVVPQAVRVEVDDSWKHLLNLDAYVVYPVTPLQRSMVYSTLNDPSAYVIQVPLPVDPNVSSAALGNAFVKLVERCEILRTTFLTTTSGIVQVIRSDVSDMVPIAVVGDLDDIMARDLARGFSIGDKYFVRFTIVSNATNQHALMTIHHALYDGWSLPMIVADWMALQTILEASCAATSPLPYTLLQHAFESRAVSHPDVPAIEFSNEVFTYSELNFKANAVAKQLTNMNVHVGSRVAVIMERCLEFTIGLLSVLKAGGTMMPLDATFPANRLAFVLLDANASAVVTTRAHASRIEEMQLNIPVLFIQSDDLSECEFEPKDNQLATENDEVYVVYTSGSTGTPKGVPVLHKGAVNAVIQRNSMVPVEQGQRVLQFMSVGFDVCQWEIWMALSHGATLVLRGDDPYATLSTIDTWMCTVTALLQSGDPSNYPNLKCIATGGESMPSSLKDLWSPRVRLLNCYGPSECSITTHYEVLSVDTPISIGKPIDNVTSYVLDDQQRLVPIGVVGELYLGGICISNGYINLPDQTAERFLLDPFSVGSDQRLFRTGDSARMLPNGNIQILGRLDTQVKVKGYRVELDEVAEAMMQHPDVVTAAAILKDKTNLVGYYAPKQVDPVELHQVVAAQLPSYMVPDMWVGLDSLPQSVNGKIDRRALQALDVDVTIEPLETAEEIQLAQVWSDVLGVPFADIGRTSSFFALGGDSISVVKVVGACRELGIVLSVGQVVKEALLWRVAAAATLESVVDVPVVSVDRSIIAAIVAEWSEKLNFSGTDVVVYPVTHLQAEFLKISHSMPYTFAMQSTFKLPSDMACEDVCRAFRTVVDRNELLRTTFVEHKSKYYQLIRPDTSDIDIHVDSSSTSLDEFLARDLKRGFQVGEKHFVRLAIVIVNGSCHAVLTIHHALYDAWSFGMTTSDFRSALANEALPSRPSFRSAIDYIEADADTAAAFWRRYLATAPFPNDAPFVLDLVDSVTTATLELPCSRPLQVSRDDLNAVAKVVDVPVYIILRYAWALTWKQFTGRDTIVFAQTMANRSLPVKNVDRYAQVNLYL
ncbi:hypothetical protein DYB32_002012 [Aphanomyces invadans]|uniref:Carrier domain-containing protein n=1 Tax=Aphanomyces invadans TaxID=157072 RepID=A0A418B4H0_9STRA|nr:hypothetical protein DYB32_002012 [Aphanomyces invadans]